MPRVPLDHPATYDDLVALPEPRRRRDLGRRVYTSPRPAPRHSLAASWLAAALMPRFARGGEPGGGWIILQEPELHLRGDVLVPDIAGWRRERMPRLPKPDYFPLAPDWICEVLSPSTAAIDRAKKLRIYAREGVRHAWLVDPLSQTLEILRLHAGRWTLVAVHAGDEPVRAEPFEALEIELSVLWGEPEDAEEAPPAER